MSEMHRAVIPYESIDPLTIGAAGTTSVPGHARGRDPSGQPARRDPSGGARGRGRRDRGSAHALEHPHSGPRFSELLKAANGVAIVIDNQFRPTPQSRILPAVFDALEAAGIDDAVVVCANGKVFPMSESDTEQKIGKDNLARMERMGIAFFQNDPQNEAMYTFIGVSSRDPGLAAQGGRETRL